VSKTLNSSSETSQIEGQAVNLKVKQYFKAVAHARYVIRRVLRIVDEQAKKESLEPLEHQALIQVCGPQNGPVMITELANRLDIVPAFASRLVRDLEEKDLVSRRRSEYDKRVTLVAITTQGTEVLSRINERVRLHVDVFKDELSDEERSDAFSVFAFYVGMPQGIQDLGEDL